MFRNERGTFSRHENPIIAGFPSGESRIASSRCKSALIQRVKSAATIGVVEE
jgi:hypothetical protein